MSASLARECEPSSCPAGRLVKTTYTRSLRRYFSCNAHLEFDMDSTCGRCACLCVKQGLFQHQKTGMVTCSLLQVGVKISAYMLWSACFQLSCLSLGLASPLMRVDHCITMSVISIFRHQDNQSGCPANGLFTGPAQQLERAMSLCLELETCCSRTAGAS